MSRVTLAQPAELRIGDEVSIEVPMHDPRKWQRFKAWITGKPRPIVGRRQLFRVTKVIHSKAFDAEEIE